MNRLIFDTLAFLNAFIAVLLIGVCALAGWNAPLFFMAKPLGLIVGGGVGLVAAAVVCGSLAFFALVERHLRTIAEGQSAPRTSAGSLSGQIVRQEPRL
ncbi:MAG: hypothetical protein JWP26_126 [Devosia sp.]|uniref:hypothetical protein n=1 Tax=Devosia sp. TaxID=1871048 RepID=UPI0026230386|nr:hypothetical protein [Devosia sp.]MDB5537517.1 hypothetical protein [Devosia sp.]MDB5585156.1 hypothetical protein [Devosia sp.]